MRQSTPLLRCPPLLKSVMWSPAVFSGRGNCVAIARNIDAWKYIFSHALQTMQASPRQRHFTGSRAAACERRAWGTSDYHSYFCRHQFWVDIRSKRTLISINLSGDPGHLIRRECVNVSSACRCTAHDWKALGMPACDWDAKRWSGCSNREIWDASNDPAGGTFHRGEQLLDIEHVGGRNQILVCMNKTSSEQNHLTLSTGCSEIHVRHEDSIPSSSEFNWAGCSHCWVLPEQMCRIPNGRTQMVRSMKMADHLVHVEAVGNWKQQLLCLWKSVALFTSPSMALEVKGLSFIPWVESAFFLTQQRGNISHEVIWRYFTPKWGHLNALQDQQKQRFMFISAREIARW